MGKKGTTTTTKLATLRVESGLSFMEIRDLIGLQPSTLCCWERGKIQSIPDRSWDKAIRLADLYGISPSYLRHLVEEAWQQNNQLHSNGINGVFVETKSIDNLADKARDSLDKIQNVVNKSIYPKLIDFETFTEQMGLNDSENAVLPHEDTEWKFEDNEEVISQNTTTELYEQKGLLERIYGKVDYNDFIIIQKLLKEEDQHE